MRRAAIILAFITIPILPVPQQAQIHGTVQGMILSHDSSGIPGAAFHLLGTTLGRITRPDGTFLLGRILAGKYQARVYARQKKECFMEITVNAGDTADITIILQDSLIHSDTIRARRIIRPGPVGTIHRIDGSELLPADTAERSPSAIDTNGAAFFFRESLHTKRGSPFPGTSPHNAGYPIIHSRYNRTSSYALRKTDSRSSGGLFISAHLPLSLSIVIIRPVSVKIRFIPYFNGSCLHIS